MHETHHCYAEASESHAMRCLRRIPKPTSCALLLTVCLLLLVSPNLRHDGTLAPVAARAQSVPGSPGGVDAKVEADAPEIGRYGGTFVSAQTNEPRTFNPIVSTNIATDAVLDPIFDSLVEQNYLTGEIEPALAESWTAGNGGRIWTFTLRRGVRWSDGRPFTVDDVLFSLEAIFAPGVATRFRALFTFDGTPVTWRRLDDLRLQFVMGQPVGLFDRLIGQLPIVPRHRLQERLARGAAAFNPTWGVNTPPREIIGTGPFVMQSYALGERIVYLRNPHYWKVDRSGSRLPYLTRFVLLIVPEDAARLRFMAKETDVYFARPREFADLKLGERAGNYTIYDGAETSLVPYLLLNQNPKAIFPPKLTWFQDVRFRRALSHAIDRNAIITQVAAGRATAAWGPVSVGNQLYYNPNLPRYLYDLERARQLLGEAGFRQGGDGVLRDTGGNPVEFTLHVSAQVPDYVAAANLVRQDFNRLGIRVTLAPEAGSNIITRLDTSRWETLMIGWRGDIEPGAQRHYWMSSGAFHDWHPRQETPATEWEAEIDRIFERVAQEVDQRRRRQLYFRFQEIFAQQVPILPLFYAKTQPAVRNTLGNIKIGLDGAIGRLEWRYYRAAYR